MGWRQRQQLTSGRSNKHHLHVAPDSKTAVVECGTDATPDVRLFSFADRTMKPLFETPAAEGQPQISPDGKWLACISNATGRYEVYVRGFPSMSGPWQITAGGGTQPPDVLPGCFRQHLVA